MSQTVWDTILPGSTSGTQLATILDNFKDAVISGMNGTARPSEIDPGGTWVDTTTTTWVLNIWSGTVDIPLFSINTLTGSASISSADSSITISKISADAVGPLLKFLKERIANNGQTVPGDSVGDIDFYGTTDAGLEEKLASVMVVATESTTAIAQGSYMAFNTTKTGETALEERMRITGNGGVVIGATSTTEDFEVAGSAKFDSLTVTTATTFVTATATTGNFVNLNATTENVTTSNIVTANATTANIVTENVTTSHVVTANATTANIVTENVTTSNIVTANATTANIVTADITTALIDTATMITANATTANIVDLIVSGASTLASLVVTASSSLANATIQSPVRLDAKKDTKANLDTYASTGINGELLYATDEKKYYGIKDGATDSLGGGGAGDASTIDLTNPNDLTDATVTNITRQGNNAAFDGGGAITLNSLSISATAADLLFNEKVIKYKPAANGVNDYFGFVKDIPKSCRGNLIGISFWYKTDATTLNNDFRHCIKITDGALAGTIQYDSLPASSSKANKWGTTFQVPSDCTQIEFGIQNTDTTTTLEFYWDQILLASDPVVSTNVANITAWTSYTPTGSWSTNTTYTGKWRRVGENMEVQVKVATSGAPTAAALTVNLPTGYSIDSTKYVEDGNSAKFGWGTINDNTATVFTSIYAGPNNSTSVAIYNTKADQTYTYWGSVSATTPMTWAASDYLAINFSVPIQGWSANDQFILTPATSGMETWRISSAQNAMTDIAASVQFPAAPTVYKNGSASSQTEFALTTNIIRHDRSTDPSKFIANVPCKITVSAVVGETGSANNILNITDSSSLVTTGNNATSGYPMTVTTELHLKKDDYFTLGVTLGSIASTATVMYMNIQAVAASSAFLAAIPTERVAFLKDIQTNGTNGGGSSAGWQTRVLNTIQGDTEIVALSSNQFTLWSGIYDLDAIAPANAVNRHKIKLRNISDSTDDIIGSSEYASGISRSRLVGRIILISPKIFEIQHYCELAIGTNGLGIPSSASVSEVYTQVKIRKIVR
jgi:hypothetical protein